MSEDLEAGSKIFIVTEGEYSSYKIVAVFSSKDKAEKFVELQGNSEWDDWEIEEYIIDSYETQTRHNLKFFEVNMDRDGNSKIRSDHWYDKDMEAYGTRDEFLMERSYYDPPRHDLDRYGREETGRSLLFVKTFAKDEHHAAKIANEIRAQRITSGEWDAFDEKLKSNDHSPIL